MAKFCLTCSKHFSLLNADVKLVVNLIRLQTKILADIMISHDPMHTCTIY